MADALRRSRSYNLDIAPKLLSCEGELVEILIRSGVGRYLEFKGVDDIFMFDEKTKHLEKVCKKGITVKRQNLSACFSFFLPVGTKFKRRRVWK